MKILIIGSGYVGSSLAKDLQKHCYVTVTTRSEDRLDELQSKLQNVEILDTEDVSKLCSLLEDKDAIIITVAAKSSKDYERAYLKTAKNLSKALKSSKNSVKQIIYTSASSVYGDQCGNVTEESSPLKAKTSCGKILIETEKTLLSLQTNSTKVCIFRLSEIYGPGREVSQRVKTLSELSAPGTGLNPTNMIHIDDINSAIIFALKNSLSGIYNLTDDEHIERKEMYDFVSEKFSLPLVVFDETKTSIHSGNKILSNKKIKKTGYKFVHPKRIYN